MAVTEGSIAVTEGAGKLLDTAIVTTGVGAVHREGTFLGDPETPAARQRVTNAAPVAADYGAAVRLGDGHNVVEGLTTDAAVITDVAGTLSGKLRGLVKWAFERMPAALGQGTMAQSLPVVVASNQSAVPVSGTVTTSPPANASTNLAQVVGTAADVNSGLKSAGTLRVVLATDQPALTNKLLVTPDSVALPANQSVNAAQFGGTNVVTGTGAGGAGIPRVTVSNDSNVIVTPPTLTKGTQGATGFSVQELKDAGRVNICWTAEFAFAQTAETLLTITESRDGAATTTFTTKVVTSGKRLRITSMLLEVETLGTGTTVPQRCYLRMRFNTAGAVTASSPLQFVGGVGAQPPAILKTAGWEAWSFPDGIEYLGDGTKQIGFTLESPDWVVTTQTGRAKVTITAFEY